MVKMMVFAVAKEERSFKRKNSNEETVVKRVIFGKKDETTENVWNGYVPMMKKRSFNGENYTVNYVEVNVKCFKNGYAPVPGDLVQVDTDLYGNIISVAKAQ